MYNLRRYVLRLYLNDSYNNPSVKSSIESVQMLHVINEGVSEGNLFYL